MMVGAYTLDLYCDNRKDTYREDRKIHEFDEFPHEYVGQTKSQCLRHARQDGWRIGKKMLCPKCSGKKPIDFQIRDVSQ